MSLSEIRETLSEAHGRETTVMLCNCEVEYDGRARSDLGGGDRVVVTKADGTVLVHGPEKSKPRNWMTPGASISFEVVDDDSVLHIAVTQESGEGIEHLDIWVDTVYEVVTHRLLDGREKNLVGTERDLQDLVVDDPDLIDEGLRVEQREYETDAGPVDVFGYDRDGTPLLAELKRRQIGPDAVQQLRRYMELEFGAPVAESDARGVLVAPSISERAEGMLDEYGFEFVSVDVRRSVSRESTALTDF